MENIYTPKQLYFSEMCLSDGFEHGKKTFIDEYIQSNITDEQMKNPVVLATWQDVAESEFSIFHKAFRAKLKEVSEATTPKREKKVKV